MPVFRPSPLLVVICVAILVAGVLFLRSGSAVRGPDLVEEVMLPIEVINVIEELGVSIEGSQPTTLRWIADAEDFISVNLSAQSFGLGFMKKSKFDEIELLVLDRSTVESTNDAMTPMAGQKGFRASGRACIIGFTYTDSSITDESLFEAGDREVYGIIVCSPG